MLFDFSHLKQTNVSYLSHGLRVFKVSIVLIALGIIGIIHGLFPFAFVKTVSNGVKRVADDISHF